MSCCAKIPHIARLRKTLRRWRKTALSASGSLTPSDVPAGHVAVRVGANCTRYIVLARHLNHPVFKKLLVQAEEEFGFKNSGPLVIPCDETIFQEIIRILSRSKFIIPGRISNLDKFQRQRHVGVSSNCESRPLLNELFDKSVW